MSIQARFFKILFLSFCCCAIHTISFAAPENVVEAPLVMPDTNLTEMFETPVLMSNTKPVNIEHKQGGLALMPYVDWLLDEKGEMTIDAVTSERYQAVFQPYPIVDMPLKQGLVWLRIKVEPTMIAENQNSKIAELDLGSTIQGIERVWIRPLDGKLSSAPKTAEGLYNISELQNGGEIYLAVEGIPSLWFTPQLRTEHEKITSTENRFNPLLIAALAILTVLCLLRSITEKGEWRFWAGLFALAAFVGAISGIPATPRGMLIPSDLIPLFAVAFALFLLPHVGRQIMATYETAPVIDFFLLICAFIGAVIGVLPLVPSMAWLVRYFELWQLGAVLPLLPTLYLFIRGVKGSGLYLLALLALLLGTGIGLLGIGGVLSTPIWALAPLSGTVLAILFIAASSPRKLVFEDDDNPSSRRNKKKNLPKNKNIRKKQPESTNTPLSISSANNSLNTVNIDDDDTMSAGIPLSIGNVNVINGINEFTDVNKSTFFEANSLDTALPFIRMEQALRVPIDALMREMCFLEQSIGNLTDRQKQEVTQRFDRIVGIGKDLAVLTGSLAKLSKQQNPKNTVKVVFNLQDVLKQVYDKVRFEAESAKIALSWYRSPHLALWYKGDKETLSSILYLLISDAIRATKEGMVFLRVQRDEKSDDFGRLSFTVGDSGKGMPPLKRASLLLAKVWELTANHQGRLSVESDEEGTNIHFILNFIAMQDDALTERVLPSTQPVVKPQADNERILIIAENSMQRHLYGFQLAKMPCYVTEAQNTYMGIAQYKNTPCAIVIFDSSLSEDDIITSIAEIRGFEGEYSLPHTYFLALTKTQETADALDMAGCDYTVEFSIRRVALRELIGKILEDAKNPQIIRRSPAKTAEEIFSEPSTEADIPFNFEGMQTSANDIPQTPDTTLELTPKQNKDKKKKSFFSSLFGKKEISQTMLPDDTPDDNLSLGIVSEPIPIQKLNEVAPTMALTLAQPVVKEAEISQETIVAPPSNTIQNFTLFMPPAPTTKKKTKNNQTSSLELVYKEPNKEINTLSQKNNKTEEFFEPAIEFEELSFEEKKEEIWVLTDDMVVNEEKELEPIQQVEVTAYQVADEKELMKEELSHIPDTLSKIQEEEIFEEKVLDNINETAEQEAEFQNPSVQKHNFASRKLNSKEELFVRLGDLHQNIASADFDILHSKLEEFRTYAESIHLYELADILLDFQDAHLVGADLEKLYDILKSKVKELTEETE